VRTIIGLLQHLLTFNLVFGKWIAPKDGLSTDQLAILLLSYIGNGADVVDMLGLADIDNVSTKLITSVIVKL